MKLPYKKRNLNHIKGLHACALATLAEYSTGLVLITQLDPKTYRIIMKKIQMEYYYQGKTHAVTTFQITNEWLEKHVIAPIKSGNPALIECKAEIYDINNNKLADGLVTWQIKAWSEVKTKL